MLGGGGAVDYAALTGPTPVIATSMALGLTDGGLDESK